MAILNDGNGDQTHKIIKKYVMNKKIAIGIGNAVLTTEVMTLGHKAIGGDKTIVLWEEHEKCIYILKNLMQ